MQFYYSGMSLWARIFFSFFKSKIPSPKLKFIIRNSKSTSKFEIKNVPITSLENNLYPKSKIRIIPKNIKYELKISKFFFNKEEILP